MFYLYQLYNIDSICRVDSSRKKTHSLGNLVKVTKLDYESLSSRVFYFRVNLFS